MSMSKKDFVMVADHLRQLTRDDSYPDFDSVLGALTEAFAKLNPKFDREIFVGYVRFECGPNGGKISEKIVDVQRPRATLAP